MYIKSKLYLPIDKLKVRLDFIILLFNHNDFILITLYYTDYITYKLNESKVAKKNLPLS